MNGEKFDSRLRAEIEERLRRGMYTGVSADEVSKQPIPVTITHA